MPLPRERRYIPPAARQGCFRQVQPLPADGVREGWIADPDEKPVQVFDLEEGRYTAEDFGAAGDRLWVNVLENRATDLSQVFPE